MYSLDSYLWPVSHLPDKSGATFAIVALGVGSRSLSRTTLARLNSGQQTRLARHLEASDLACHATRRAIFRALFVVVVLQSFQSIWITHTQLVNKRTMLLYLWPSGHRPSVAARRHKARQVRHGLCVERTSARDRHVEHTIPAVDVAALRANSTRRFTLRESSVNVLIIGNESKASVNMVYLQPIVCPPLVRVALRVSGARSMTRPRQCWRCRRRRRRRRRA